MASQMMQNNGMQSNMMHNTNNMMQNQMQNQQFHNRFQQQYQPNNFHHQGERHELQHDERTELPRTEVQGEHAVQQHAIRPGHEHRLHDEIHEGIHGEQIQQDGQHCPKELRQQPGLLPGVLQAHGKPGHEIQASSQRKHQTSWI